MTRPQRLPSLWLAPSHSPLLSALPQSPLTPLPSLSLHSSPCQHSSLPPKTLQPRVSTSILRLASRNPGLLPRGLHSQLFGRELHLANGGHSAKTSATLDLLLFLSAQLGWHGQHCSLLDSLTYHETNCQPAFLQPQPWDFCSERASMCPVSLGCRTVKGSAAWRF